MEQQQTILEELQNTFIRNVNHELRTPLSIVQGYAELLCDGAMGQLVPEQQQAVKIIVDRALHLRRLVDRISILMELRTSRRATVLVPLDDVVQQSLRTWRAEAARTGLEFQAHIEPDLPALYCEPQHVQEALECLLENAIKFTPTGGSVLVQVYSEPGWICYSVQDTGVGIPEERMTELFSGFYQADGSATRRYGGIGLGLTVVKAVVDAYAGTLQVTSQPGQGSQFTLRLPVESQQPCADETHPASSLSVRRILVVDDEENVALTLQGGLEKLPNCQVTVATSGEQALRLFEQQPFDLLVTDYKMPGTDGMTLASRVHAAHPPTSIIMITAYANQELREQAMRAAVHCILDKPVKLAQVRSAALEALQLTMPSV